MPRNDNDMDSLINEKGEGKVFSEKNDLRTSLCYYLSLILVLLAFILSCVSLGFCSTVPVRLWRYV